MDSMKSEKFKKARATLPENLRPIYDEFVAQYAFHTTRLFGRGYVAYEVLASLVRDGWRPTAEPLNETIQSD
ncbi:hypothetical protein ACFL3Q_00160 [Planctomycetota bacterium]